MKEAIRRCLVNRIEKTKNRLSCRPAEQTIPSDLKRSSVNGYGTRLDRLPPFGHSVVRLRRVERQKGSQKKAGDQFASSHGSRELSIAVKEDHHA